MLVLILPFERVILFSVSSFESGDIDIQGWFFMQIIFLVARKPNEDAEVLKRLSGFSDPW